MLMRVVTLSKCGLCLLATAQLTLVGCAAGPQRGVVEVARPAAEPDGGGGALSLDRAVRLALDHNAGLRASAARKDAAAGRAVQARAWPNPELELSDEDIPATRSRLSQSKRMVGLSQTIPYPGKKKADGEIGDAEAAAVAADWRADRAGLVRDVKIAFRQVQAAERSVAVADELARVAQAAADAATKRAEAGGITLQERLRAEIQLERAKGEKTDALREVAVARQELLFLLGRPDLREARLAGGPEEAGDPGLLERGAGSWLAGHPAMVAARARRDQALATSRRATLEPMSDVKVGVAGGRDHAAEENLVELRVSIPVPFFDRNKGRRQEAQAGVREAEAEVAATEQRLRAEWCAAAERYKAAAAQVAAHRERILPKSEEALGLVQTGFAEGKLDFIDLLDTQRTAAEAKLIYQKKLLELAVARAELEAFSEPVPAP